MTPYSFGRMLKLAMDPRPNVPSSEGRPKQLTANIGGQLEDPTPVYEKDPGLPFRRQRHYDQVNSAYNDVSQAHYDAKNNIEETKHLGHLARIAPALGSVAGTVTGQPMLANMAGTVGSLGASLGAAENSQSQKYYQNQLQQATQRYNKLVPPKQILSNGYDIGSASPRHPWNAGK